MKRFWLVLVLLMPFLGLAAQVEKLGDIHFPNTPGLIIHESPDFRYFADGPLHICTYEVFSTKYCVVYNQQTGTSQNSSFIPRRVYDFGTEKRYWGVRVTGSGSTQFNRYARMTEDGQFIDVPSLPAVPKAFRNGKGYTVSNNALFEIALNPFAVTTLHTFESPIEGSTTEIHISGDTVYMAHKHGYSAFSLSDSLWDAPFEAYFDAFDLQLVPKTGIHGRHLYAELGAPNTLHEIGGQTTARMIPVIDNIPNYSFINAFLPQFSHGEEQGRNVTNGNQHTWINLLTRIGESWDQQDHLIEINRSENDPGISVLKSYKRGKNAGYRRAALAALKDGERLVALGLFGDEGYEPYGFSNEGISVLKDLIPGRAGSVDYLVEATSSNVNNPGLFAEAYGRFYFVGTTPGFGREICVSDGTPEGTHVLADLQPGLKGLRRVRFANDGGQLYAFVQMHDYRTAVYRIGPQIPSPPVPEENGVAWEAFTAPVVEEAYRFNMLTSDGGPQTSFSSDGFLYQLLEGVRLGLASSDSLTSDDYNFSLNFTSNSRTFRIDKIDPSTGERVWRKPLLTYNTGSSNRSFKMLAGSDGKVRVLTTGLVEYADAEQNLIIPPIGHPVGNNTASLVTLGAGGALDGIVRIQYDEWLRDVLHVSEAVDGNFVGIFSASPSSVRLLKFDGNGELLAIQNTDLRAFDEIRCWQDDQNLLWISNHPKNPNCQNCLAQLLSFDNDLKPVDRLSFRYSGSILRPGVHHLSNGERWFTGAFDGNLQFDFANGIQTFEADNAGRLRPFVIRELKAFNFFQDAVLIEAEALGYGRSFVREGNVFISYFEDGQPDIPPSGENIYGTHSIPQVRQLNHVLLQLDGVGLPATAHIQTAYCERNKFDNLNLRDGLLQSGMWWQSTIGMHMEWKSPEPEFLRHYHTGAQIAVMSWPFSPVDVPEIPTTPDEEESYMHLFPNPTATGSFYIIPNGGNLIPFSRFHIHDMQGRLVAESQLNDFFNVQEVQMPQHLNAGVYHVVFTGQEARESHRLVMVK